MGNEQLDTAKLRVLLPHWIEHNSEHAAEFRSWAEKAGAAGAHIQEAASLLENVNRALEAALKQLGESGEVDLR
jgi:predicted metallo-beta-lactamase superfamily hydrolase